MTQRTLLAAAVAFALAWPAAAADTPKPDASFSFNFEFDLPTLLADAGDMQRHAESMHEQAEQMREWAEAFSADMQGSMAFMFSDRVGSGKVVKGAPYSAEIVTERNQNLADGNSISHESRARVYRDAEGRTRQETMRGDKLRSVYITDPVANMTYTLLPGAKIAIASPRHEHAPHPPRARVERDRTSGDTTIVSGEKRVTVKRIEKSDAMPGAEEVRVQIYRINDDGRDVAAGVRAPTPPAAPIPPQPPGDAATPLPPLPPIPPMPGVQTMRFESTAHLGKGTTASLGTKSFEGVGAEGKSTTWTIPAGQIGNKKPIQIVSESWYSPELQVTVYSRYSDPRTGESVYRLASVKRAEPSPDLFKVPDEYRTRKRSDVHTAPPAPPAPPTPAVPPATAPESRR